MKKGVGKGRLVPGVSKYNLLVGKWFEYICKRSSIPSNAGKTSTPGISMYLSRNAGPQFMANLNF